MSNKKIQVTTIFAFSRNVLKSFFPIKPFNTGLCGKRLTLSHTANFRLLQTETVCRRQFLTLWKVAKSLQKGRKHCGKRRNCMLWAISPFSILFPKDLYCRHVKARASLGKGKTHYWEAREKIKVTTIFAFSRNVLKSFFHSNLSTQDCVAKGYLLAQIHLCDILLWQTVWTF